jgi:septal ring factor EnvC (AmiA/AmiB activator)
MGNCASKTLNHLAVLVGLMVCAGPVRVDAARRPADLPRDLNALRGEINVLERDLLSSRESQATAAAQLKKIRKLTALQRREIQLSKSRIGELEASLSELSEQKRALMNGIEKQKISLRQKLRELQRLTESEALDASWIRGLDVENQKTYFMTKTLHKDLAKVDELKRNVQAALGLELRILEEKNKLDYYIQEEETQISLLGANETIFKEVLRTNHASRLEALARIRALKESEHEVESMIAKQEPASKSPGTGMLAFRGKLPLPADGAVLSGFGKSYNPKTNLLTFQKGITVGAKPASDVHAVLGGKVAFSGPLKNYGLIVILEHPGQYYTLYGQMGALDVAKGADVTQGQVLGKTAGEPLYFEIRNKNVAINPLQWLSNNPITLSKK